MIDHNPLEHGIRNPPIDPTLPLNHPYELTCALQIYNSSPTSNRTSPTLAVANIPCSYHTGKIHCRGQAGDDKTSWDFGMGLLRQVATVVPPEDAVSS